MIRWKSLEMNLISLGWENSQKLPKPAQKELVWFLTVFGRFLSQGWSDCHWTNGLYYTSKISQHSYSLCKMKVRVVFLNYHPLYFLNFHFADKIIKKNIKLGYTFCLYKSDNQKKEKNSNITITLLRLKWNIHQNEYD